VNINDRIPSNFGCVCGLQPAVDFLLVITELFSLVGMTEALWASRRFWSGPKFHVEGDVSHQPFLVSENYIHRYFIRCKMWTEVSLCLSQFTRFTDRRANVLLVLRRPCISAAQSILSVRPQSFQVYCTPPVYHRNWPSTHRDAFIRREIRVWFSVLC